MTKHSDLNYFPFFPNKGFKFSESLETRLTAYELEVHQTEKWRPGPEGLLKTGGERNEKRFPLAFLSGRFSSVPHAL